MTEPLSFDDLDDSALDKLPFGVVRIGPAGQVERLNRIEADRAGYQRWRVLGRDYFREVVGSNGAVLATQIAALSPGGRVRVFHTFQRYRRTDDVVIDASRTEAGGTYLCITRS